jgi:hypothetical protein
MMIMMTTRARAIESYTVVRVAMIAPGSSFIGRFLAFVCNTARLLALPIFWGRCDISAGAVPPPNHEIVSENVGEYPSQCVYEHKRIVIKIAMEFATAACEPVRIVQQLCRFFLSPVVRHPMPQQLECDNAAGVA